MSTIDVPVSYSSLALKDITVSHVPPDSPSATKVLVVAFNRPDRHNAVTENLLTELETVYRVVDQDQRVRVIVLTGKGKAFCAGAVLQGRPGRSSDGQLHQAHHCRPQRACSRLWVHHHFSRRHPRGMVWSKGCPPFARLGLTLESCSAFFLPRLIGLAKATHIATTGETYMASDPLVSSLFSKLLPTPEDALAYAVELATQIGENTSLTSTKLMRDMLLYSPDTPEETHILDSKVFISVVGSKDNMAGIRSTMKKQIPEFNGAFDREPVPFWPWWEPKNDSRLKSKL